MQDEIKYTKTLSDFLEEDKSRYPNTLSAVLEDCAQKYGDRPALGKAFETPLTYNDVWTRVVQISQLLTDRGVSITVDKILGHVLELCFYIKPALRPGGVQDFYLFKKIFQGLGKGL